MRASKRLAGALTALGLLAQALTPAAAQVPQAAVQGPRLPATAAPQPPQAPPAVLPARPGARLAPGQPIPPAELEAFVDGVVRAGLATDHVAGATVSVVQYGQPVLVKGYGFARLNPATPVDPNRHLFRIGSLSKTFTWILLMREVEAGRVQLNQPVNSYLPEALQVPAGGWSKPIRVVDLTGHAPGFEDQTLGSLFVRDPADLTDAAEFLRRHRPERVREPGLFPTYSNYGTALAAEIVTRTARAPDYPTLVERDVLRPAGLTRTTFREPYPARQGLPAPLSGPMANDFADGHRWTGGTFAKNRFEHIVHIAGVGGGSTTAADMARYMTLLLNEGALDGATIYGPRAAQAFKTPSIAPIEGVTQWRHGFMTTDLPGGFTGFGHGGATLGFMTNLVVVPELGLGVFISTNTDTGTGLVTRLPRLLVERFYANAAPVRLAGDPAWTEANGGKYAGAYLGTRRTYGGLEGFVSRLAGYAKVSPTGDGYLAIQAGETTRLYAPTRTPGRFLAADGSGPLLFDLDEGGKAAGWSAVSGSQNFERAKGFDNPDLFNVLFLLTLVAAAATWIGAATRLGRVIRPTDHQALSNLVSLVVAALWLLSVGAFMIWGAGAMENAEVAVYEWPHWAVRTGSILALLAAIGTIMLALLLWPAWKSADRRGDGWSVFRKLRHTAAVAIWALFSVTLAFWGALSFWS